MHAVWTEAQQAPSDPGNIPQLFHWRTGWDWSGTMSYRLRAHGRRLVGDFNLNEAVSFVKQFEQTRPWAPAATRAG